MVEEQLNSIGRCTLAVEKGNQQHCVSGQHHKVLSEEPNQEMIRTAGTIPLESHMLPANSSIQQVEASCLKGPTNKGFDLKAPNEGVQVEATHVATDAAALPASHGQNSPSMGHQPAGRLMGFVVRQTPKLDQIIREIEREGALVFAMQGEMIGAGSWACNMATATQK